jgi:tight adherence protein B
MIDRDLPALLTTIASSVRAGIDPIRAMCDAESYFPLRSPFVAEIRKFKSSFEEGKDEVVAIEQFLREDSSVDLLLFKQCLLLSRQLGSSLADPLHRVVRVVRSRQSFRRKTRAALAMHRMSAVGIALCALLIVGMQVVVDSSRVAMTIQHPVGRVLLCGGVSLIGLGVIWMLRMGREEKV